MPFDWTINPYRGCEFGCKYCYARYTHEFMELRRPEEFETRIFAKQFSAASFRSELAGIPLAERIAIGTATDPYQPAERRFRITRAMLEVLAGERGRRISLISKSDLVARDADLFERIARRSVLHLTLTVTTMDAGLARLLEPRAPRPELRMRAVEELSRRGIVAGVFTSPVLPLINDSMDSLRRVAQSAAHAGARYWGAGVVFLKPCSKQVFFPFLEERFPHLAERYRKRFAESAFLHGAYPERIRKMVEEIRRGLRLEKRAIEYTPELGEEQLSLFDTMVSSV
ncbi:MAG: radical SAM protein [Acidobacteria bacterium]|nr:radical SAM protein [Acidobacteriota bacterium]